MKYTGTLYALSVMTLFAAFSTDGMAAKTYALKDCLSEEQCATKLKMGKVLFCCTNIPASDFKKASSILKRNAKSACKSCKLEMVN